MSKQTYTLEQAARIGKDVLNAAKTYGSQSGLVNWAAENDGFVILAAAIKVAVDAPASSAQQKATRKGALDGWTNTLKRVKQGEKPGKGESDLRPYLAFTRDEGNVTVYWKTPEPKAPKADKGGEGEGDEQVEAAPTSLTNEQLLLLVQARIEADAGFAEQMEEMLAAVLG